jgi:hypothetical protein
MDVDQALESLGKYGVWQLWHYGLYASAMMIPACFQLLGIIFTGKSDIKIGMYMVSSESQSVIEIGSLCCEVPEPYRRRTVNEDVYTYLSFLPVCSKTGDLSRPTCTSKNTSSAIFVCYFDHFDEWETRVKNMKDLSNYDKPEVSKVYIT